MGESNPLVGIPGITILRSEIGEDWSHWFFRPESSADSGTAAAIIDCLGGNRTLCFTDPNYRSIPGAAFISAMRHPASFLAKASFSHSSSAWAVVSREELVAYLTLCMRLRGPESENPFYISDFRGRYHLWRVDRTPWASFRNTMALRLGRPTYLQERLQPYGLGMVGEQLAAFWRFWL